MDIENILIKTEHTDEDYCSIIEEEIELKSEEDLEFPNETPYKCGICGHRTTTDVLLKVHMRMHLVKRVHQCNICKKTFSFVTELNSHILTHTEHKSSLQCDICGRDCFTEEDLHKHYRVHTKEKPFKCKLCSRSFSDDSYLRVHERSHHGEEYLKKTMKKDGTYVNPSLVQSLTKDSTPRVSVQKETEPKKFKLSSNVPLSDEEKLLLLQYVEALGISKNYQKLEEIKNYIKISWTRMAELFASNDYDRNPEKLTRTYFHLKNRAKSHIDRFYKNKKLSELHDIDYMLVKLCPNDFNIPGINLLQVLEESKKRLTSEHTQERKGSSSSPCSEDEENDNVGQSASERLSVVPDGSCISSASKLSQKRKLVQQENEPLEKLLKADNDLELIDISEIRFQSFLDEERRNSLYKIELKQKEELFNMEKKHKEALYEKELEIKNIELALLKKKLKLCV